MESGKKERIIVLSVDRDNDLGEKAEVEGPVIGKEHVIDAATKLGLKDPGDTDFNSLFEAVRVYEELRKQYDSEIAALSGDRNVGIKSDKKISEQLNIVLKRFRANFAVLVTDGSEDEQIIPIIQSVIPILSVKRVVVKQSEQLESTYYKVKDFIKESLENPKMSRLVFGLPAIALLLIAIFGAEGWRAIMGILGAYLVIKGFRLESYFTGAAEELSDAFTRKRFAFFMYVLGIIFAGLAAYRGYTFMTDWFVMGFFETIAAFLSASVYYFWLAGAVAWVGKGVSSKSRSARRIASIPIFGFAVTLVIHSGANLILQPDSPIYNFILSIVVGFVLLFAAVYIEKK
jgi:putative membrane protein